MALLYLSYWGSSHCAPPVPTKCSTASLTGAGRSYFSKASPALWAASASVAVARSRFACVISTHAFPSSGSPAAAVSGGLAGGGEAADELGFGVGGGGLVG